MTADTRAHSSPPKKTGRRPASGGVAAQGSQAIGSFVLQLLAARLLGLDALGRFAMVFSLIVLATAVSSGFVGDSLTVLDRAASHIRAALQTWAIVIASGFALLFALGSGTLGFLAWNDSILFGLATTAFVLEDLIRRLLMSTLHFWRIVIVDVVALLGALTYFATITVAGSITFGQILAALAVGQTAAIVAGVALLPGAERFAVRPSAVGLRDVAAYGIWRSLQQAVRAATMAVMRVLLLTTVTATAVGELELARIYLAPAALGVVGISSYLFASFARARACGSLEEMLHFADRAVVKLFFAVSVLGALALLAVPIVGPVLTDGETDLSLLAVAGWAALASTTALVTPYGQLASVHGRQRSVFAIRLTESIASLAVMYVAVAATDSAMWAPVALAVCSLPSGWAIRKLLIVNQIRSKQPQDA